MRSHDAVPSTSSRQSHIFFLLNFCRIGHRAIHLFASFPLNSAPVCSPSVLLTNSGCGSDAGPMRCGAVRRALANEWWRAIWAAKAKWKVILSKGHQTTTSSAITLCTTSIDRRFTCLHLAERKAASNSHNGPHQADGEEIDRRQSAQEAVGDQSCPEISAVDRRRQEREAIPSRNRRPAGDSTIPEIDGAAHEEAAVPAIGEGDCR